MPTDQANTERGGLSWLRTSLPFWLAVAAVVAVFAYIFVITAWFSDDSLISLKQVWNAAHGYGFTLELGSRVQAFTHPLWVLIHTAATFVTRELYFTNLAISAACALTAVALIVAVAWRAAAAHEQFAFALLPVLFLTFSQGFTDYMTSGLENPLSYLLVALIVWLGFDRPAGEPRLVARPLLIALLCALLALTRLDLILLVLPLGIVLLFQAQGASLRLGIVLVAAVPLLAWHGFALWYFGSALPNTFYAKLMAGFPLDERLDRGMSWLLATFQRDNITFTLTAWGLVLSWWTGSSLLRALALGAALYIGYMFYAGGDFMMGRFLSVPVLVGVMCLTALFAQAITLAKVALLFPWLIAIATGFIPILSPTTGLSVSAFGTTNERWFYYTAYGLLSPDRSWPKPALPKTPTAVEVRCGGFGVGSLTASTTLYIDNCGLGDALLARLPAIRDPNWRTGHPVRRIPEGYIDYRMGRRAAVADPGLQPLVEDIAIVTRGDLFDPRRWDAIWRLNVTSPYRYDTETLAAPP